MLGRCAVAFTVAVTSTACTGAYAVNYRVSRGADMAPANTDAGLTTSIRYRDYGGLLSKALLLVLSQPSAPRGTTETKSEVSTSCGVSECTVTTTTTTTYTPPTPEEMEAFGKRAQEWGDTVAPAILSGGFAAEAVVDLASQSLGGDTSGGMIGLNFRLPTDDFGPFLTSNLSLGLGYGNYTMHGRKHRLLRPTPAMDALVQTESTEDLHYHYIGLPVRFTGLVTRRLATYLQLDLNIQSIVDGLEGDPANSQIVRLGITGFLPFVGVTLEVSADRLRTDSATVSAEVGVAF